MLRKALLFLAVIGLVAFVLISRRPRGVVVDTTMVAERDVFRSYVTASGEIVAKRYADIGASVMGRVVSLRVKEGDRVVTGQVLARLDSVRAAADVAAAESAVRALGDDLKAAEAGLNRATPPGPPSRRRRLGSMPSRTAPIRPRPSFAGSGTPWPRRRWWRRWTASSPGFRFARARWS
jgi:multidrug efflux pump subunit AcrA (membrane-fusion protein)